MPPLQTQFPATFLTRISSQGVAPLPVTDNLRLWFTPRDLSTLYADDDMTTPASGGGKVGAMVDKSGIRPAALVSVDEARPTLSLTAAGGRPGLVFTGVEYLISTFGATLTQPCTRYAVLAVDASGRGSFRTPLDGIVSTNRHALAQTNSNRWSVNAGAGSISGGIIDTGLHVFTMCFNGSSSFLRCDGVPVYTGQANTQSVTGLVIGGRYDQNGSNQFIGVISDVIDYSGVHTVETMEMVEDYLLTVFKRPYYEKVTSLADMTHIGLYETTNPVMIAVGTTGESDRRVREPGNVLYEPDDTGREYKFWYTGYDAGRDADEKIHYAYSGDGHTWTKFGSNPIIAQRAEDPYVVKVDDTYYLYAEDKGGLGDAYIRRWSTTDPEGTWTDDGVISITNAQSPVVWVEDETWYLIYENYPTAPLDIRLATSADGLNWTAEATNPIIAIGETSWDADVIVPDDIYKQGDTYYLFYHAQYQVGTWREGVASSTDLLNWTDSSNNPISAMDWGVLHNAETVMVFFDTELVFMHFEFEANGIYRGYPLRRVSR